MKRYFGSMFVPAVLSLLAIFLCSCEKSDTDKDYGFPVIYIPQATVTGLDNSYPVPNGPFGQYSSYTCYYKDGILNIAIGVVRAGCLKNNEAFSVTLGVSESETERKLAELGGKGTAAVKMPSDVYTIPKTIDVASGKNTGTCHISVNLKKLAQKQPSLIIDGKYNLLVLGLAISEPTRYELSETNTSVILILDLNSSHWDNVSPELPESEVRNIFPTL